MTVMGEQAFERELAENAHALVACVARSAAELKAHGRRPVTVRMHPLDAELIVAHQFPAAMKQRLLRFCGLQVVYDDDCRLGWPVAEFDPEEGKAVGSTHNLRRAPRNDATP